MRRRTEFVLRRGVHSGIFKEESYRVPRPRRRWGARLVTSPKQPIAEAKEWIIKHRKKLVSIVASEGMDLAVAYAMPYLAPILSTVGISKASQQALLVDLIRKTLQYAV